MKSTLLRASFAIFGPLFVQAAPGLAQEYPTPAEAVGTWKAVTSPYDLFFSYIMTLHSNNTWLETRLRVVDGDTLSCTKEYRPQTYSKKAYNPWTPPSDTVVFWQVKGQQLVHQDVGRKQTVFERIDPAKEPLRRVIASGFAMGQAIPAHPKKPTGTIADFYGAWETDSAQPALPDAPTKQSLRDDDGTIKRILIFRPNRKVVEIQTRKVGEDTVACSNVDDLPKMTWQGDSIVVDGSAAASTNTSKPRALMGLLGQPGRGYMVDRIKGQNGRLNVYVFGWDSDIDPKRPFEGYRPIELSK